MTKNGIRLIEGTRDYYGEAGARFEQALAAAAAVFPRYGYDKLTTPIFEATELFARSIGEATDIVEKEMYTFKPGSDTITLRPEGTAGAVRALLQNNLHKQGGLAKLWYAGPMFRRERPQKGRQRQFHQVGVEAVGAADPLLDAEIVSLGLAYYRHLGISGIKVRLNSIGCPRPECRPAYREKLREAVRPRLGELCKTCQARFERNVLRILDCKNEACAAVTRDLPASADNLCDECGPHFAAVRGALEALGVEYAVSPSLVRGLDYYTKTVFEFTHGSLGAQDAIGGGGRYDGLVEELGGPALPAVGFALGVERAMIALEVLGAAEAAAGLDVFGVGLDAACRAKIAQLLAQTREAGFSADMDYEGRSFKAQLRAADKRGARVALILGGDELARGVAVLKDMRGGGQTEVALADCPAALARLLAKGEPPHA